MKRLIGAQQIVLQAISKIQEETGDPALDTQVAERTNIAINNVRDWFLTLMKDEYVDLVRTQSGYSASITENGRLTLDLFKPFSAEEKVNVRPQRATSKRTILLVAANPKGTDHLRLDEEAKKIDQGLERAKNRDQFQLVMKWAVTDDDLRRALLDHKPEIVHFSGHGTGSGKGTGVRDLIPLPGDDDSGGLAFENDQGSVRLIPGDALARLFELCADHVKCVVLNACYSEVQAGAISKHIDFVIGMRKAIGDNAAIQFAVGFYDALGAGEDFDKAFKFGCSAIDLKGIPERLTPVLKRKL